MNINVTPEVVRELDDLIKRGVFKGNYKFGDPGTGASALARHDAVTLYFLENPSDEAIKALSDISKRNFRGEHLLGKRISDGFYMSEVGSVSGTHAKEMVEKMSTVDNKLGKAIGNFLTDRTGRIAMSEAQYYATKETLNLYGYDISYDKEKGIILGKFEQTEKGEKQKKWDEKRNEIDEITDATGRGIDEGIKDTVTAFNVNEISTSQSCEGHNEVEGGHRPWPWVEVSAPDYPAERFVGESEAFVKTAQENNIPLEDLKRGHPEELYWELRKKITQNPYTPEYQAWEKKNIELHDKVLKLLDEFYEGRKTEKGIRLEADDTEGGSFEISSAQEVLNKFLNDELTPEEKKDLLDKLPRRQKEMAEFTEFLKKRYLGDEMGNKDVPKSIEYDIPADSMLLVEYVKVKFGKFAESDSKSFNEMWTGTDLDHFKKYMIMSLRTLIKDRSDEEEYFDSIKSVCRTTEEKFILQKLMVANGDPAMELEEFDKQSFSKVAQKYLGLNVEEVDKDYYEHFNK